MGGLIGRLSKWTRGRARVHSGQALLWAWPVVPNIYRKRHPRALLFRDDAKCLGGDKANESSKHNVRWLFISASSGLFLIVG